MWDDSDVFDDSGAGFLKYDGEKPGPSKGPEERKARNLVAVSVDQLNKLYTLEYGLVIHNQRVSSITIVGRVESVHEQTTSSAFILRDECGPGVEVNFWTLDEKRESNNHAPIVVEDTLVRVHGQARSKDGRVYISAFQVAPVKDINEIAIHNLEVIFHCKMLERMKLNQLANYTNGHASDGVYGQQDEPMESSSGLSGLTPAQELLLKRIMTVDTPEGISLQDILDSVHSMDQRSVKNNIDFLLREGHVYTTIDEDHFKATNM